MIEDQEDRHKTKQRGGDEDVWRQNPPAGSHVYDWLKIVLSLTRWFYHLSKKKIRFMTTLTNKHKVCMVYG